MILSFFVPGHPKAQGSLRAFKHAKTGAIITPQDKKVVSWRGVISTYASQTMQGADPIDGPVRVELSFVMNRPKCHYRTGKNSCMLRDDAPERPIGKNTGDIDKLTRAVFDALTGIVFLDDCQVVASASVKAYGQKEGVMVIVNSAKTPGFLRNA